MRAQVKPSKREANRLSVVVANELSHVREITFATCERHQIGNIDEGWKYRLISSARNVCEKVPQTPAKSRNHMASTLCGRRKCLKNGAPGEIRTPDLMVRSHALYPTELRAQH
jgi:hypothetical protein